MQIKQAFLAQALEKNLVPLYLLIGQDNYLLEDSVRLIRAALRKSYSTMQASVKNYPSSEESSTYSWDKEVPCELDEKSLPLQNLQDWETLEREIKTYSLFTDALLLNTIYEKKSLDAKGKKVLENYLQETRNQCVIIIRASQLSLKTLQTISQHNKVVLVLCYPLDAKQMLSWIVKELRKNSISFVPEVPQLIHQYTEGNMLATAQVIEKIVLSVPEQSVLSACAIMDYLSDQSQYSLFELVAACLKGEAANAVHMLQQASQNKTEAILVLRILTQEVRLLLQMAFLLEKGNDFKMVCGQLKIWAFRMSMYQLASQRFSIAFLTQLLRYCLVLDQQIKTESRAPIWDSLEKLALGLSLGEASCII